MKKITCLILLIVILVLVHGVEAQNDYPTKEYITDEIGWIKKDYQKSDIVAAVKIDGQKLNQTVGNPVQNGSGGYAEYLIKGKVIHCYKGKFRDNQEIAFYRMVEGLRDGELLRQEIYFLKYVVDKDKKRVLVEVEENSNREIRNEFETALIELETQRVKRLAANQPSAEKRQILQAIFDQDEFIRSIKHSDAVFQKDAGKATQKTLRIVKNEIAVKYRLSLLNIKFDGGKVSFVRTAKTKTPQRNLIVIKDFLMQDEMNFYIRFMMDAENLDAFYRFWRVNDHWEIVDFEIAPLQKSRGD